MPQALSPASRKCLDVVRVLLLDRADHEVAVARPGRTCRPRCCPRTRPRGRGCPCRRRAAAAASAWASSGQNCLAYIASAVAPRMSSPLTARPGRRAPGSASRLAWSTSVVEGRLRIGAAEVADRLVGRAGREEAADRALEAGRLLAQVGLRRVDVAVGVDGAVEHHRAVVVREEARVGRAQERAVREAEVVELLVAHRGADAVHVARDVGGRDVRQDALVEARRSA